MTQTEKFNFGQSFDPGAIQEELRNAPKHSDDDMIAARKAAHDEGHAAGLAAALEREEHRLVELLTSLAARAESLAGDFQQHIAAHASQAQELGMLVCRKLLPTLAQRHGLAEIEGLIAECLNTLPDEPRVVVRVDNTTLPQLQERIDRIAAGAAGFAGNLVLLADDNLASTDCQILWADGGADRDVAKLTAEIDEVIDRHLNGPGTPAAPQIHEEATATHENSDATQAAAEAAGAASS